jgi:hypothetical protein
MQIERNVIEKLESEPASRVRYNAQNRQSLLSLSTARRETLKEGWPADVLATINWAEDGRGRGCRRLLPRFR